MLNSKQLPQALQAIADRHQQRKAAAIAEVEAKFERAKKTVVQEYNKALIEKLVHKVAALGVDATVENVASWGPRISRIRHGADEHLFAYFLDYDRDKPFSENKSGFLLAVREETKMIYDEQKRTVTITIE